VADQQRIAAWRKRVEGQMYREILVLYEHRRLWLETREILETNPDLPPSVWWDWISDVYSYSQAVAVRRQVDADDRSAGLLRLLIEVEPVSGALTRNWWLSQFDGVPGPVIVDAERRWDDHFETDHLEPDTVTADINELRTASEKVKHFVDRGVAHSDRRALKPDELPTLEDVHESIDVVGCVYQRYAMLLTQGIPSLSPVIPEDWKAIFRVPWLR
jgi:hypothetical protein